MNGTLLDRDRIIVWSILLDPESYSPAQVSLWRQMLSAEEHEHADAFRGEEHRRDYLAPHAALRFVLGKCTGVPAASVQFAAGATGMGSRQKPVLFSEHATQIAKSGRSQVCFSLSHTRGAALIGVAASREIGVDIEWHRAMPDMQSLAKTVMSINEFQFWKALKTEEQNEAFYHLWTRKESYLKAIGLGLYRELQQVTVPISAGLLSVDSVGSPASLRVRDEAGEGAWFVIDLPVMGGYSASLCFEADPAQTCARMPAIEMLALSLDEIA